MRRVSTSLDSVEIGAFVLGMDRSGTSAVTGLMGLLGLRKPPEDDLVRARDANPKGVWESESLVGFNRRVLSAVGSDERFPLVLEPGWESDSRLDPLRDPAPRAFREVFPAGPWVWKDPLHCLTFSFWRSTLDVRPVVVIVNRNPLEIAASALRAWGRGKIYGLALWERYLRQALGQVEALPVLVTSYGELLSSPAAWCERTHRFLAESGMPVQLPAEQDARGYVDASLRHAEHARADVLADPEVSDAQKTLFLALEELEGGHEAFSAPALPEETPTTEALLAERREAFRMKDELERLLEIERQSRWSSRIRRSRLVAPARPFYAGGRRVLKALSGAVGSASPRT